MKTFIAIIAFTAFLTVGAIHAVSQILPMGAL
jgi:hypothetical protein